MSMQQSHHRLLKRRLRDFVHLPGSDFVERLFEALRNAVSDRQINQQALTCGSVAFWFGLAWGASERKFRSLRKPIPCLAPATPAPKAGNSSAQLRSTRVLSKLKCTHTVLPLFMPVESVDTSTEPGSTNPFHAGHLVRMEKVLAETLRKRAIGSRIFLRSRSSTAADVDRKNCPCHKGALPLCHCQLPWPGTCLFHSVQLRVRLHTKVPASCPSQSYHCCCLSSGLQSGSCSPWLMSQPDAFRRSRWRAGRLYRSRTIRKAKQRGNAA